ncbi:MAG TPA: hypothetical protein VN948_15255 [Terriglobales bacterium]|nr:hypothetical protein [Terriglobales bacterium]
MYDYVALHHAYTTIRVVLFCVAVTFWILYFHEILFRSGRIRTQWLKKELANLLLMLSIAIVTFLVFSLLSGVHLTHYRPR